VVTFGERLFLKVYRRLRAGVNPELEVGRFLTEVARFANCVPVAGALEYAAGDGTPMTLGLLQAYVPNEGDGWALTMTYLERYLESQRAATEPPPADVHGAYLAHAHTLGVRTAELHAALATPSGDPAFDPEPVAPGEVAEWKRRVREEALAALDALESARSAFPAPDRDDAQSLDGQRGRLLARIDACAAPESGLVKTRYHGDYHLGQVLLAQNDFVIIDFEGEPARPLAERRAKHSALRDVAGMLRSVSYARWSALRSVAHSKDDLARLAPLAAAWEAEARATFLRAYDESARSAGLYPSLAAVRDLLGLFELEKAFYELRYEMANRPAWVRIPLLGILALAGEAPQGKEGPDGKA
jgi:maltose alpha-D-glucosyltransferase/alpha-amylase